jgi:D-tyrosyl-tRNA(Tyr) deacylase
MRAVVQRVSEATVSVDSHEVGRIKAGLVVLLAVGDGDDDRTAAYVADKIAGLRIFQDAEGKMNLSAVDAHGAILLISQFTLYGDCRKGRRPSFTRAAAPDEARRLYEAVATRLRESGLEVQTGRFQEYMAVSLVNDGPVTLLIDSERAF